MNTREFVGSVAARVVSALAERGYPGIRIQNVTPFCVETLLKSLHVKPRPRIAVTGGGITELARAAKYPKTLLTADLAEATEWRNDRTVTEPVVVITSGEEERSGSFHRFTEVRDRDLYREICEMALGEICPNDVQRDWWITLGKLDVMRHLSVQRLANYHQYVASHPRRIPEAARDGLYLLGMLPSREFFERASVVQLAKNFSANRQLTNRIEILSNADRDRLGRAVDAASGKARDAMLETLGRILKYNRSGSDADRQKLTAEGVRSLFEAKKKPGTKTKPGKVVPIERAGIDAILDGDDEEVTGLGKKLRDTLDSFDEDEPSAVTVELSDRGEQATAKISAPLVKLLHRTVTPTVFGGRFKCPNADSVGDAVTDIDDAEFSPFDLEGEKSCQAILKRVVEAELIEPEIYSHWESFLEHRGVLAASAAAIAVSPLVALASDPAVMETARRYLQTYEALTTGIRERYERIASVTSQGSRHLCAQFLILDTILFETSSGLQAILSPLHPLHLWKYVRLADQLRDERQTLSEDFRHILGESAERLPHFLTALYVPEGLVSQRYYVLPESGQLGTLPLYQEDCPHFAGTEGQDKLLRILRKFLVIYPHAKRSLRVVIVDPPDLPGLLELLASRISDDSLPVGGLRLTVRRTLERPISLGTDDQQLEAIGSVFSADEGCHFVLDVDDRKTTYTDVVATLADDPVHVLAIFDPSRSQVGQFVARDRGFLHPLVLPKQFQYDPIEDHVSIEPAATGDLFDSYYALQSRLNNALSGSHFGISSSLGPDFPSSGNLLKTCTWLVLGDRLLDAIPVADSHMISFEPGRRRDLMVMTESLTKFEREFDYYLRKANLDPPAESLRELIVSSAELVGEGLLGLIRADGDE